MRSQDKKVFYFHAAAATLGGFIEAPFAKNIPSQASVSLPAVGGEATARTGAFNFEEIVSCRAAYTRVTGRQQGTDGPWSITATAVVEGLNILDTFTADRLVAQVSIEYPKEGNSLKVSLAGSTFDGLRIGGCDATPALNPTLLCGARGPLDHSHFEQGARELVRKMKEAIGKEEKPKDFQWLKERFASDRKGTCCLSSLVDRIPQTIPGATFGHAMDIPEFGRIFLGEVFACPTSIQVYSFRAELGCGMQGSIAGASAGVRGHPYP